MPLLSKLIAELKRFHADERGAAAIEFLMTLPLLIGAMVFTAEYGNALRTKMVLTTATADVTRFLARSPIKEASSGSGNFAFYDKFLTDASEIISARMGGAVTLSHSIERVDDLPFDLRSTPYEIKVRADASLSMPLLGFINQTVQWANQFTAINPSGTTEVVATSVPIAAQIEAVWIGESEVGIADCSLAEIGLNRCNNAPEAGS